MIKEDIVTKSVKISFDEEDLRYALAEYLHSSKSLYLPTENIDIKFNDNSVEVSCVVTKDISGEKL